MHLFFSQMHNDFFHVVDKVQNLTFVACICLVSSSENITLVLFKDSEYKSFNSGSFMVEGTHKWIIAHSFGMCEQFKFSKS